MIPTRFTETSVGDMFVGKLKKHETKNFNQKNPTSFSGSSIFFINVAHYITLLPPDVKCERIQEWIDY